MAGPPRSRSSGWWRPSSAWRPYRVRPTLPTHWPWRCAISVPRGCALPSPPRRERRRDRVAAGLAAGAHRRGRGAARRARRGVPGDRSPAGSGDREHRGAAGAARPHPRARGRHRAVRLSDSRRTAHLRGVARRPWRGSGAGAVGPVHPRPRHTGPGRGRGRRRRLVCRAGRGAEDGSAAGARAEGEAAGARRGGQPGRYWRRWCRAWRRARRAERARLWPGRDTAGAGGGPRRRTGRGRAAPGPADVGRCTMSRATSARREVLAQPGGDEAVASGDPGDVVAGGSRVGASGDAGVGGGGHPAGAAVQAVAGGVGGAARPVDPVADPAELADEARRRPRRLEEFIGQAQLTEHLHIVIEAARRRQQAVDHLLFVGPPGLGKTSLAGIVAAEMGVGLRVTSGPALARAGDLAAILTDLQAGDVLFVDEIHRLPRPVEEVLYPAMEDFQLDILIGKGPTARSIRLDLPRFTLVGATTRTGLLTGPLRDRFGFVGRLDLYGPDDLQRIVLRSAAILGVDVDDDGAWEIARRSRGTPRIANRLLRRVRDFVEVRADGVVTAERAAEGLELFGVDQLGLDKVDRAILDALCRRFGGGPVGLTTLAQCVGEEAGTVEDAYEPYLLQQGLLQRTPRGRLATAGAFAHLGLDPVDPLRPEDVTPSLW